jgi:hypothetical protein
MDSHICTGHARARHVMRMNYCGFSAVNASISLVRRANVQAAVQAGQVSYDLYGAKLELSDGVRPKAEVLRFMA